MLVMHVYISRRHVRWLPRHYYCPIYIFYTPKAFHTIFCRPCTLQVSLRGLELLNVSSTDAVLPLLTLLQNNTPAFETPVSIRIAYV